jgi:uncharacterized membrane protein YgcG
VKDVKKVPRAAVSAERKVEAASVKVVAVVAVAATAAAAMVQVERTVETEDCEGGQLVVPWRRSRRWESGDGRASCGEESSGEIGGGEGRSEGNGGER